MMLGLLFLQAMQFFGQSVTILPKGENYSAPDEMVVMDKYTFGKYHYTAIKYDTLKREIIVLDSLILKKDSAQEKLIQNYEAMLKAKENETGLYRDGMSDMKTALQSSLEKNDRLMVDYKKLEAKRQRTKRWRNFFMGTSALSTGILVLILAL